MPSRPSSFQKLLSGAPPDVSIGENDKVNEMPVNATSVHDPVDIMQSLKGYSFLKGYHLLLFCSLGKAASASGDHWEPCLAHQRPEAWNLPFAFYHEILEVACIGRRPTTSRSPEGVYVFAVPFSLQDDSLYCLVGTGVRDKALDLGGVESLAATTQRDPVELLELFQNCPVAEKKDVEDVADRVFRIIKENLPQTPQTGQSDDVLDKLAAVVAICSEIDKMTTSAATISLFLDTLTIIFDIPHIGIVFTGNACQELFLEGEWAPPAVVKKIIPHRIHNLFPLENTGKSFIVGGEIASLFPEQDVGMATCLQFMANDDNCGLVALLETKLRGGDVSLVELVCNRVATRLQNLLQAEQLLRANTQSQKMLDLISSMLKIEDHNKLYDTLLSTATGLVGAVSGSFMVMDKNGEDLHIEAVRGINSHLAKSFTVKVGEGIAGKVAAGASPLLISDIENDSRTARLNRSRFRTKSFVSLPFSYNQQVIGVLNISDKENGGTFNENDLETLSFFADHTAGVVHHAAAKAAWASCRSMTVSDPLTGLYNRSFLFRRMQEEVSRCKRLTRCLSLMRIEIFGLGDASERAMKTIAGVLRGMLREMDVISRYGENSFCIMLPDTGKSESVLVGERIRTEIVDTLARLDSAPLGNACVTIGLSAFPEDGKSVDEMATAAEKATFRPTFFTSAATEVKAPTVSSGLLPGSRITLHDSRQRLPLLHNRQCQGSQPDVQPVLHPYTCWPCEQSEQRK